MKKLKVPLVWAFTISAIAFLYFSFRTEDNGMLYTFIALGLWGVAYLTNKYLPGEKKEET